MHSSQNMGNNIHICNCPKVAYSELQEWMHYHSIEQYTWILEKPMLSQFNSERKEVYTLKYQNQAQLMYGIKKPNSAIYLWWRVVTKWGMEWGQFWSAGNVLFLIWKRWYPLNRGVVYKNSVIWIHLIFAVFFVFYATINKFQNRSSVYSFFIVKYEQI